MKIKLILIFFIALTFGNTVFAQKGFPFDNEIQAFKKQDIINFPPKNGILFIGSSSIRLWDDLESRFPDKPIIKRGVGGSELSQLVDFYTPFILFPYNPAKIFIYDGENDIAAGKDANFVFAEFKSLWEMIHEKLPGAKIYFMSIKPSPSRAKYFGVVKEANHKIREFMIKKKNSIFIDMGTVLLKNDLSGPDSSLFKPDYLHLNSKGYDRWQRILEPYVN